MSGAIAKPALRGHLNKRIARALTIGIGSSFIVAAIFKVTVADPKKQKYADFYKTYDPMVDFRRMRDLGLLQSAKPGDPE